MSNPTEQLDPCPFCGSTSLHIETNSVQPDDYHDAWVHCDECDADGRHAMTLEGWLSSKEEAKQEAVVAWNRRAQPEGEAPQADLGDRWHSLTCDGTCSPPCKDAPAAQHAESGAPATITRYSFDPTAVEEVDEHGEWVRHSDHCAALAAQSQGAQPSLAALDQAWKLGLKADVDGWADLRAQQAAAPGASIDTPEFRELLAKVWNGSHPKFNSKSIAALVAHIDSRAAPSAPGTPEAPAADDLLEAVARAIWNIRREEEDRCDMELEDMGDDHPVWDEAEAAIAAIQRAAQLDGGQEGSESNG